MAVSCAFCSVVLCCLHALVPLLFFVCLCCAVLICLCASPFGLQVALRVVLSSALLGWLACVPFLVCIMCRICGSGVKGSWARLCLQRACLLSCFVVFFGVLACSVIVCVLALCLLLDMLICCVESLCVTVSCAFCIFVPCCLHAVVFPVLFVCVCAVLF